MSAPDFNFREGFNTASLTLPRNGDSTPAAFWLRAKTFDTPQRFAQIYATLWYKSLYLGKIVRPITITKTVAGRSPAALERPSMRQTSMQSALQKTTPQNETAINFNTSLQSPDLTVFILETSKRPEEATIIINSPHLQCSSTSFVVPIGLSNWLEQQYNKLAQLAARNVEPIAGSSRVNLTNKEQAAALLRGFGQELYRKFAPVAFQEAFWKLADKLGHKFHTIQILTNNPVLPWELMRPIRPTPNGEEERDFLGIEFRLARWHVSESPKQLSKPPQSLGMRELAVIAPQYSGNLALHNQKQEIAALEAMPGFQRISGNLAGLKILFSAFPDGIIHFAGHGTVRAREMGAREYVIKLEDSDLDVLTWRGLILQHSERHPFFFFNACEVGQAHHIANFVDGWAPAILETGASGYIGGLWPLGDKGAAEFAIYFYKLLQQKLKTGPVVLADLLRESRQRFYENGDPTFLAYVYYGDPNFRFERENK